MRVMVKRALVSVFNKAGITDFCRSLHEAGVEIISTGGTAAALQQAGVPVTPVDRVTGFPEMLEGRVKTLHPAVHGGLLADRSKPEQMAVIQAHGIQPIDLVVINLYPFEQTIARPAVTREEAIENIDIGGPSMIRSAAKNHAAVATLTDPADYADVLDEIRTGGVTESTRARLAAKAFDLTSRYDAAIAAYLNGQAAHSPFPDVMRTEWIKATDLRYGENPHQRAALYLEPTSGEPGAANARKVHGKELSFINLLDLNAALELVKEFDRPACSIIKHTNPCGCATAESLVEAYRLARDGELPPFNPPGSRFGGIIACNRAIDAETADEIIAPKSYYECIIAPAFSPEAEEMFKTRKIWGENVRLMVTGPLPTFSTLQEQASGLAALDFKRIVGGLLVQERDLREQRASDLRVATERTPSDGEMSDLLFAWKVVRHVKSNAVILAKGGQLIGLGAGQTNRARSSELAVQMAGPRSDGAVCASDAFFPMPDGPEALARAGVKAIIQPGGSKKDDEAIAVCNRYGVAMVFTGARHFRH
ncbi:MAG TPA: bifunctional phosphoribosylaminoimidazolecarboxamide formyltransferase/IMP cyclohydrolase [Armatimonadota bacterium]|nr:bifunctional phosphoribosylaminoimidazolecarboxamide formyltransferase/IMP cyclohydrolase [Armatimonadota bacterium]